MEFHYNSLSQRYKQPFGCVREQQLCRMMLEVRSDIPVTRLELVLVSDDGHDRRITFTPAGISGEFREYRGEFSIPDSGLYFYHFHVEFPDNTCELYRCGEYEMAYHQGDRWQLTCIPAGFDTPEAFRGTVMYQIFPDRFCREGSCDLTGKLEPYWIHRHWGETPHFLPDEKGEILNNDFFGGNLKGICSKLDYLRELGVDVIYLNPICMAFSNHRYDTAHYKRIDPMLGTDEDFSALCTHAHRLGMKVILDGVFSHTGCNSIYFDSFGVFGGGAVSDPNSPYRRWFDFQEYPNRYTAWWGIRTLPCVNETEESFLDYIIRDEDSVVAHWLGLGADGFRLDVADELPDSFLAALRKRLKELNPDALLLGEVWEDASNKVSYGVRRAYFTGGELDSVMNYPFRNAILSYMAHCNSDDFRRAVMTIVDHYPDCVLHCVMNSLSTHDTPRILTLLGDDCSGSKEEKAARRLEGERLEWALQREKTAALLQFTLPGCPCIYYGDEVGLQGHEDPLNRACYPWGAEHLPLLEFYRSLVKLKRELPALKTGVISFCPAPPQALCYLREQDGQRLRILISGNSSATFPLSGQPLLVHRGRREGETLVLDSWGGAVILENPGEIM